MHAEYGLLDRNRPIEWGHPLNLGLVGEWAVTPLSGWRGGATLRDLVRGGHNPNDGTLTNTTRAVWAGTSLQFTSNFGGTGYVSVPNATGFFDWTSTAKVSLMMLWNVSSFGSSFPTTYSAFASTTAGQSTGWRFNVNDNTNRQLTILGTQFGSTVITATGTTTLLLNTWYTVGFVVDRVNNVCKLYLNGRNDTASASLPFTNSTSANKPLTFASDNTGGDGIAGGLRDAAYFTRALSDAEMLDLHREILLGNPNRCRWVRPVFYSFPSSLSQVGQYSNELWNDRACVSQCDKELWNTRATAGKTNQDIWSERNIVGPAAYLLWALRARVGGVSSDIWNTRGCANNPNQLIWIDKARVGAADDWLWALRAKVGPSIYEVWSLRSCVNNPSDLIWSVRQTASLAGEDLWAVRQCANNASDIIWSARSTAGKTDKLIWSDLLRVGVASDEVWADRARVGSPAQELWSLRSLVRKDGDDLWAVRNTVSPAVSIPWTDKSRVGISSVDIWNEALRVGPPTQSLWGVRSTINRGDYALWNARKCVGPTVSIPWNLRFRIGVSSDVLWSGRLLVHQDRDGLWNVRACASKSGVALWHVNEFVMAVTQGILAQWNTKQRVGLSDVLPWTTIAIRLSVNSAIEVQVTQSVLFNTEIAGEIE